MLYPNPRRTKRRTIRQYRETMKQLNREIYQWLMNITLITSNPNLHRSPFLYEEKLQKVNFLGHFASTVEVLSSAILSWIITENAMV